MDHRSEDYILTPGLQCFSNPDVGRALDWGILKSDYGDSKTHKVEDNVGGKEKEIGSILIQIGNAEMLIYRRRLHIK